MLPWERSQQNIQSPVALEDLFTPEQLAHLVSLHADSRALRIAESGLDPNRVQFVCWLVEHGKLGEDVAVTSRDPALPAPVPAGDSHSDGHDRRVPSTEEVA